MPLHPKIEVSSGGIHGRCWFAGDDIKCGELLWWAPEKPEEGEIIVTIAEMESWSAEKREKFMALAYQIDDTHMAGFPEDESLIDYDVLKENFVNHSCDGVAWYEGKDRLVALRDIKKGEEIAYDYALTEAHPTFMLNCRCGTSKCRGAVTGNDWKIPELRQRYEGHFMPHILELIAAEKNAE